MFSFFKYKFAFIDKVASLSEIDNNWSMNDLAAAIRVIGAKDEITELFLEQSKKDIEQN